jgi:hypothetical protein
VRDERCPRMKDERNVSMAFCMHAGHFKPQGIYKSVKYSPLNVQAECLRCHKFLHGNLDAYSVALEKRYRWNSRTSERQSKLHFAYAVRLLEKMTAVAKLSVKKYLICYESIRPNDKKEVARAA